MPTTTRLLDIADAVAARFGWLHRPFSAEHLVARATQRAGLSDLGDVAIMEPLQRLLDACLHEADLSLIGRLATRWDVLRFISNLLRLRAEERCAPSILQQIIQQPIFITGLPRSGTTFLHRLMLEDERNRAPRVWETIYPYPTGRRDCRAAKVDRQLRGFERLAPGFQSLHPLNAESPQECCEITAHVFRSLRFDTTYYIPSYQQWLDANGQLAGYRFHHRFLQHLQQQDEAGGRTGGRWVLKCPDHLFALADLRAAFPDARVVFVHRDPVKVLLSLTQLTEVLRRPFTRHLDPRQIGRGESARWYEGTLRMTQAADATIFAEPVCHVHYLDLVTDPLATVEGVYRHFGMELSPKAAQRIARVVAEQPNGGYGPHVYRFEDHGLDAEAEQEKFRSYMIHFGIEPESSGGPHSAEIALSAIRPARTGAT